MDTYIIAHEKLQFTRNMKRPTTYTIPKDITLRSLMTFQQQGKDQPIHQFLGVIYDPRRYCYKIWEKDGLKLASSQSQVRGAGSSNTVPFNDIDTHNNIRVLLLPATQYTAALISEHKSPRLRWPKAAVDIPEWIQQVASHLIPYSSYHINTDGSYKKRSKGYDDIFLTDNDPAHLDRISAGASIKIAPQTQSALTTAMHTYKRRELNWNTIVLPHGTDCDRGGPSTSSTHQNTNYGRDSQDSLGCCQIANRRKRQPQLTNNYIALMNPLQHHLRDFKDTLRWTPAHPENRNSMSAN